MTPLSRNTAEFRIRRFTGADLALVAPWLETPRVKAWFDEPDYIAQLQALLGDSRVRQWIVETRHRPIAYLQDYDISGWAGHPLAFLPKGARGVDTFIGLDRDMGRGLAVGYLGQHCGAMAAAGVPALGIDPHPDNHAAIRCYQKVGFTAQGRVMSPWGPALAMRLDLDLVRPQAARPNPFR